MDVKHKRENEKLWDNTNKRKKEERLTSNLSYTLRYFVAREESKKMTSKHTILTINAFWD